MDPVDATPLVPNTVEEISRYKTNLIGLSVCKTIFFLLTLFLLIQ